MSSVRSRGATTAAGVQRFEPFQFEMVMVALQAVQSCRRVLGE